MVELERICGILLLGFALLFAFRIPSHLHSADPYQQSLVHVDLVLIFILGGSGLVLLLSRRPASDATKKRERLRPRSIAVQGLFLILLFSILSLRDIVLSAGKVIVAGQVIAVNQPVTGRTTYHVTYKYTDLSGRVRTATDIVSSRKPALVDSSIDVAYSRYEPQISRAASRFSRFGVFGFFFWDLL